jgi:hypothetical protein
MGSIDTDGLGKVMNTIRKGQANEIDGKENTFQGKSVSKKSLELLLQTMPSKLVLITK